ncbi:MAG: methionine synthase, partial [Chloroflexota bacterium]|nr:methionine synthase [Chloroflexota bacterium]
LSDAMDLAKMLAVLDMVEPLQNESFRVWKQTRIGLLSHPLDPDAARGHLAAATYLQMALKPHIYHIVGHTEAHHAATADDIIVASKIIRRAIENAVRGAPDMTSDPQIAARRKQLVDEANCLLDAIASLAGPNVAEPFTDPRTLTRAVTCGLMDAPQLRNNKFGRGDIRTMIVNGANLAVNAEGRVLRESERLSSLI